MPKVKTLNLAELLKAQIHSDADIAFAKVLELMEKHGVRRDVLSGAAE